MHHESRRTFLGLGLAAALGPVAGHAQGAWPNRPIRLVLSTPPGGSVDALARAFGAQLSTTLGQPVIIENKPGASNKIAAEFVSKAPPDGYTLLSIGSSTPLIEAAAISTKTERPFDTLRDFAMVGTLATNSYALVVNSSLPIHTVQEFIAYAKARPGQVTYGTAGVAKTDHVAGELFAQRTGIKLLHVPFKGIGEAITQLLGGQIHAAFGAAAPMAPHIKAGKLRILGIVGSERSEMFPGVPTLAEVTPLPGYAVDAWLGIAAPAKTPPEIVARLNGEMAKMLKDDKFIKDGLARNGLEPFASTPVQMQAMFRKEVETYSKLFKDIGLKLD